MYWPRMISILPAIPAFFVLSSPSVSGQNRNPFPDLPALHGQNQADGSYVPWSPAAESGRDPVPDVGHTRMEKDIHELSQNDPFGAIPTPGLAAGSGAPAGSDTVSVQQLRHPLSHRGEVLLAQFQSELKKGHIDRANKLAAKALKDPSAAPYVHGILGTHYLKQGRLAAAIPELEEAEKTLPIASLHSNLGYALCLTGQTKRGEEELQEALSLDGTSPQTRFLMGLVLLNQKSREREAQADLRMAEGTVPFAHLALAICHMRRGEMQAAESQLGEFLGPNRKDDLLRLWGWAAEVATEPQPATAFGFPHQTSGSLEKPAAASQH